MPLGQDDRDMLINLLNASATLRTPPPMQQQLSPFQIQLIHRLSNELRDGNLSQPLTPTPNLPFRAGIRTPIAGPSTAVGSLLTPSPLQLSRTGVIVQTPSPQYPGNYLSVHDPAADIPPEQSTSVWITNLPPTCTYTDLLGSVRAAGHTGKIFATVINPPQELHTTSAAKIVFFEVAAKTRLLEYAARGSFVVGDYQPRVIPNRILTAARAPSSESRVLIVSGPVGVVNTGSLIEFFQTCCAFDLEYVEEWTSVDPGRITIEWAFGSYRCQAERVYRAIENARSYVGDVPNVFADVEVRWGRDPCDKPWS